MVDIYNTLARFASDNIQQATLGLLASLGIESDVMTEEQIALTDLLEKPTQAVTELCKRIQESYLVCSISDRTFTEHETENSEDIRENFGKYDQMVVFAVDLKQEASINRTEIATLTRALNRASKEAPVVLVCRYADKDGVVRFALSLCERTAYVQAGHRGEKAGRVNILRGINPLHPHTGHIRILDDLRLENNEDNFEAVYAKWLEVFDNDVLTSHFYTELQNWYFWALKEESGISFPNDIHDSTDDQKYNPQNIIRLITRLIFVWFLRQKGLVPKQLFEVESLKKLVKDFEPDNFESSSYYRVILQNLFFATLNKKIEDRAFVSSNFVINRNQGVHNIKTYLRHASDLLVSKEEFIQLLHPVPFMNNSLFECLDGKEQNGHIFNWDGFSESNNSERQSFVPNYLFFAEEDYVDLSKEYGRKKASSVKVFGLLNILKRYNFTVEENTPLDQDVALDPELLGKVFENLLAAYNPETEKTVRKSTGSYYTPRPIVQYMVDESLVAYLEKAVPTVEETVFRLLLSYGEESSRPQITEEQRQQIVKAILDCKVLDPACGSGAFPMGMLQQMNHLLSRVDEGNKYWERVVIDRALADLSFVEANEDEEKEAHKQEIEKVFALSAEYPDYTRKLYLIENCIYGADIQSIAVQITRLRFFISLLCEQTPDLTKPENNYNIKPLPNLEMKFVAANTLKRLEHIDEARVLLDNKDIIELIKQLKAVRHELFIVTNQHTKATLLSKDKTIRDKIRMSTGDCYVKEAQEKITRLQHDIKNLEHDLSEARKIPESLVETQSSYDLFGEIVMQEKHSVRERKIKDAEQRIAKAHSEIKLQATVMTSGRDKAMRLAQQLTDWNPYDQNVSSPFFDAEWMFGVKNGFDIVIGNPPYLKEATDKDAFTVLKGTPYYQGKMDLWYAFASYGLDEVCKNGFLCFIATNNWTTNDGASLFRNKINADAKILQLIDFNDYMIFESASIQTMVMLFQKNHDDNEYTFDYRKINGDKVITNILQHIGSHNIYLTAIINRETCFDSILTFSNSRNETILAKIKEKGNFHLDNVKGLKEISSGIDVLQDYVNKKSREKLGPICNIGDGIFVLNNHEYINLNLSSLEREIIKPYYTTKQIHRYYANAENSEWIIYTDSSFNAKINKYPHIKSHLDKFGSIITSVNKPYGLHRARKQSSFEGEKILALRKCVGRPQFSYVNFDTFVSRAFLIIRSNRINLKYLTALLNSTLIKFWLGCRGKMQGNNYQIDKDPLKNIPVFKPSDDIQKEIGILVDALQSHNENNDILKANAVENVIDMFIFKLYDISYDEILIIDSETPITREEYETFLA